MRDFVKNKLDPLPKVLPARNEAASEGHATQERFHLSPDPSSLSGSSGRKPRGLGGEYPHTISLRMDASLYAALQNGVTSAQTSGDYRYQSVSDLIREAMQAFFEGMQLSSNFGKVTKKRRTSFLIDDALKARYDAMPSRKRSEIIERAIRAFLEQGLSVREL